MHEWPVVVARSLTEPEAKQMKAALALRAGWLADRSTGPNAANDLLRALAQGRIRIEVEP